MDLVVCAVVMLMVEFLARRHLVIDTIEADGDGNYDGRDRQRIEERRQEGGRERKHQRQQDLGTHAQQDLGEREEQHLAQEINACHHEHEQHDDREVDLGLVEHHLGRCEAQDDRLDGEQPAGLQRIALERHGQCEYEFEDEHPARDERIVDDNNRVKDQEQDDRELVPVRRIAKEILAERVCHRVGHTFFFPVIRGLAGPAVDSSQNPRRTHRICGFSRA